MSIESIAAAAGPRVGTTEAARATFGAALEGASRSRPSAAPQRRPSPSDSAREASRPASRPGRVEALRSPAVAGAPELKAAEVLDRVTAAQRRMEKVLELAQSGKTFTPAELLAIQAQVYRASQELDLAGKVVEKATSGVKQVLQTQL
jgi:hypothetical protein